MTEHQFVDAAPISGARRTADGYLVAEVRCARTGCQDYMASDFGLSGGIVTVYRPEDVVFDKASMATFAGKPVTIGHPASPVTAENWKDVAVGDIGTEIARDGEFVRVPIKLMDAAAIQAVLDGTREISMGYTTGVEIRDGVAPDGTPYQAVQTGPIRINHLAIVPQARGGSKLRIGDGAVQWGAAPITPREKELEMSDNLKTVVLGDKAVQVAAADAHAIETFKSDTAKAVADQKSTHDKAMAAKDAELATKDARIKELEGKVLDAAALDALVKDRADLVARAKSIAPAVVTDGLAAIDIKRAVVVAKSGAEMADKSEAYIDAAFDILSKDAKDDPVAKALADAGTKKIVDLNAVYAARDAELGNAWKMEKK